MENAEVAKVAGLLKTMAHPIRLKILCLLLDEEMTVGELRDQVKTTNANVSQHLTILRNKDIISFRKEANFIYNMISDGRMFELISTMKKLFCNQEK